MQYSLKLSHKASSFYLRLYSAIKKLGIKSSMLDGATGPTGLILKVDTADKAKNYKFYDDNVTVAKLYEYKDFSTVIKGLKKMARRYHDNAFLPIQLDANNLEKLLHASSRRAADRSSQQLGALNLSKTDHGAYYDHATFGIESLDDGFFLLHTVCKLNDSSIDTLSQSRLASTVERSINIDLYLFARKAFIRHSVTTTIRRDYFNELNSMTKRANTFIEDLVMKPLVTLYGTTTTYETTIRPTQVSRDFARLSVAFSDFNNGYEKLYVEDYGDYNYVRLFERARSEESGVVDDPYQFIEDFNPIFFYRAFELYIGQIKEEVHEIVSKTKSKISLSGLFDENSSLTLKKYHLTNIQNLLDSYIWQNYITDNRSNNGSLKRINRFAGKNFDYAKDAEKWLHTSITLAQKLLDNGGQKLKSELEIKNTASNNRLSRVVLWVTLLAVGIAFFTLIITLYPKTARIWICDRHIYCTSQEN